MARAVRRWAARPATGKLNRESESNGPGPEGRPEPAGPIDIDTAAGPGAEGHRPGRMAFDTTAVSIHVSLCHAIVPIVFEFNVLMPWIGIIHS